MNLQSLALAGQAIHLTLSPLGRRAEDGWTNSTSVSLFDQGLTQVLQAAVNPAGAAIVNANGPIRQIVRNNNESRRRYLVVAEGTPFRNSVVLYKFKRRNTDSSMNRYRSQRERTRGKESKTSFGSFPSFEQIRDLTSNAQQMV